MLPPLLLTTDPVCARPDSLEAMPPGPSSPPSLEGPDIKVSW
uniref:BLTX473 n=1 Tax=Nephila pilipes TaxID=299642 RepID=A0A076L2J6_NEPPI|nr:BLTX473 [Nephila pilipes]